MEMGGIEGQPWVFGVRTGGLGMNWRYCLG